MVTGAGSKTLEGQEVRLEMSVPGLKGAKISIFAQPEAQPEPQPEGVPVAVTKQA